MSWSAKPAASTFIVKWSMCWFNFRIEADLLLGRGGNIPACKSLVLGDRVSSICYLNSFNAFYSSGSELLP